MMHELFLIMLFSIVATSFSYTLDFCLGTPGQTEADRVNVSAIFFKYSLGLAVRRLIKNNCYTSTVQKYSHQLNSENAILRKNAAIELDKELFSLGRMFFSWEHALGMCVYCTGIWIALLLSAILFFTVDLHFINHWFLFILVPIFSHILLRKL